MLHSTRLNLGSETEAAGPGEEGKKQGAKPRQEGPLGKGQVFAHFLFPLFWPLFWVPQALGQSCMRGDPGTAWGDGGRGEASVP